MPNKLHNNNNIPFDLNFNVTAQNTSQNNSSKQNSNSVPQASASNSKLGTDELLKSNHNSIINNH
jgi:hypothetical protein